MPRVTVYVPDDLKARMDETGQDINWSSVAQDAFREAVTITGIKRNPAEMEQVIERLRTSRQRVDQAARETGKECGMAWARQAAEYDELKRVAEWTKMQEVAIPYTVDALKAQIDPKGKMDRYAWHEFFAAHGDGEINDAFAEGFFRGAAELFDEIKSQLL